MNRLVIVSSAVLLTIVVFGSCYDFSDSAFNRQLAYELDELYRPQTPLHARMRRDEEAVNGQRCRGPHPKPCCGEDAIEHFHNLDLKRECFKEITGKNGEQGPPPPPPDAFKCGDMEQRKKEIGCIIECVAKKSNMLDSDGNLKEDEVKAQTPALDGKMSWFAPLKDEVLAKCFAVMKNTSISSTEMCNPKPMIFTHCLFREIQMNCPESEIKDKESCSRFREHMQRMDQP